MKKNCSWSTTYYGEMTHRKWQMIWLELAENYLQVSELHHIHISGCRMVCWSGMLVVKGVLRSSAVHLTVLVDTCTWWPVQEEAVLGMIEPVKVVSRLSSAPTTTSAGTVPASEADSCRIYGSSYSGVSFGSSFSPDNLLLTDRKSVRSRSVFYSSVTAHSSH